MTRNDLEEDLMDVVIDDLAAEYHRLNRPHERNFIDSSAIQAIASAAVGAFLLPYLKVLAEKAGEKTWEKLMSRPSPESRRALPQEEAVLTRLHASTLSDRHAAYEQAASNLAQSLVEHGLTESLATKLAISINTHIEMLAARPPSPDR